MMLSNDDGLFHHPGILLSLLIQRKQYRPLTLIALIWKLSIFIEKKERQNHLENQLRF